MAKRIWNDLGILLLENTFLIELGAWKLGKPEAGLTWSLWNTQSLASTCHMSPVSWSAHRFGTPVLWQPPPEAKDIHSGCCQLLAEVNDIRLRSSLSLNHSLKCLMSYVIFPSISNTSQTQRWNFKTHRSWSMILSKVDLEFRKCWVGQWQTFLPWCWTLTSWYCRRCCPQTPSMATPCWSTWTSGHGWRKALGKRLSFASNQKTI